jgi:hypothetical protein
MAFNIPLVLPTTGIIQNKLRDSLKLLDHHPALYILMRKAVIISYNTIHGVYLESVWQNNG